jgi:hypothetical protein
MDWGALSPLLQSFTASPGINTQQVGVCGRSLAFPKNPIWKVENTKRMDKWDLNQSS